jgi:TonB family protein
VVHLPPPPTDQVIKVRGRKILLKRGRMISDLNRPPYRPQIAERWRKPGKVHQGTYKVCVTSEGTVSSVSTLKSAGPRALDGSLREAIGNWRYQPTRLGHKRVPYCYRLGIRVTYGTADTADYTGELRTRSTAAAVGY